MVKGGDRVFGSVLIDNALTAIGLVGAQLPTRPFCPQVVTDSGEKCRSRSSETARRRRCPQALHRGCSTPGCGPARCPSTPNGCSTRPTYCSPTCGSLPRALGRRNRLPDVPTDEERHDPMSNTRTARMHELNLYRRYFDLVAIGRKTIEVRVKYPHLADMTAGDTIRFRIKDTDETCDVRVLRVAEYPDFEALLDSEGPTQGRRAAGARARGACTRPAGCGRRRCGARSSRGQRPDSRRRCVLRLWPR